MSSGILFYKIYDKKISPFHQILVKKIHLPSPQPQSKLRLYILSPLIVTLYVLPVAMLVIYFFVICSARKAKRC